MPGDLLMIQRSDAEWSLLETVGTVDAGCYLSDGVRWRCEKDGSVDEEADV